MPFATTAIAIATIASSAFGIGEGIYGMVNQPGTPKPSTTPSPLTAAQNKAQQTAVSGALPDLQALTGGSLSPEYASQFGALQSGLGNDPRAAGNIQAAINEFFGLTAPGKASFTSPTYASPSGGTALDLLKNSSPQLSQSTTAPKSPGTDFVSENLESDLFKGLTVS